MTNLQNAPSPTHQAHFLSGLPRSGSTLLSAILRQNPRFHAGMSGPMAGLYRSLLESMSANNEFSVFISDQQRARILRSVWDAYHADHPQPVIFDTNRSWCTRLPLLAELFPTSKVIACVRNVSWIMDSLERMVRKNTLQPSYIFGYQASGTVYTRVNRLAAPDGLVGYAYDALKEAYFGEQAVNRLILVRYERLVADAKTVLRDLYQALGEDEYPHDLDHVEYSAEAFDAKTGTPGLHHVHGKVEARPRQTLLPPDLFQRFARDAFWEDPAMHREGVIIL
jgi:sulfotransferase